MTVFAVNYRCVFYIRKKEKQKTIADEKWAGEVNDLERI